MAPRRCPPGIWCLTPEFAVAILLVAIVGVTLYIYTLTHAPKRQFTQQRVQVDQELPPRPQQTVNVKIKAEGGDGRYTRAPEPYREWATVPDLRGAILPQGAVPIFQPSLGYPEQFQQMGILTVPDTKQILPLFGRRVASRSDRFNYYTRTDTYNPIQLPLFYQKRDCMDDVGCQELFGSEQVRIEGLDTNANVKVYKYDAPRYIPSVY